MATLRRRVTILVTLALAAVPAVDPVRASSAPVRHYTYVAQDFYVVGPDYAASVVAATTGHHVAPLGSLRFVPSGSDVTLTIDDAGTVEGLLDVTIGQRRHEHRCVPVRQPTVLSGLTPGEPVTITIWAATFGPWMPCGAGGTAGTLRIVG